ncbi:MAG: T9SS type A sorting domain-containing protein [Bacteroidota bacterium]
MKIFRLLLPIIVLLIAIADSHSGYTSSIRTGTGVLVDTPTFCIPFTVNDNNFVSIALAFGVHPRATKGIDTALGEQEYPPFPPPGAFAAMFMGTGGNSILDLRPSLNTAQIDTYRVWIQPDAEAGYPFIFTWPDLNPYYSGQVRLVAGISGDIFNIDMRKTTSYILNDTTVNSVYIIAQNPRFGNNLATVTTVGLYSGGLTSYINSGGNSTTAWFEYGATETYGTSTSHQTAANGINSNFVAPISLGALPPNTRFHVRAVAQNSLGTFYGGDQIFSNGVPPPVLPPPATYRSFLPDSLVLDRDNFGRFGKPVLPVRDSVHFNFIMAAPASGSPLPLTLKYSQKTTGSIYSGGVSIYSWINSQQITTPSIITGGSAIRIEGFGGKPKLISTQYKWQSLPHPKWNIIHPPDYINNDMMFPMPNRITVLVDAFLYGCFSDAGGLLVGINEKEPVDSSSKYGWLLAKHYKDVLSTLQDRSGLDTGAARGFDVFTKNNPTAILGQQKTLPPMKQNNTLLAQMIALKLNIAASDSNITPPGYGDLLYMDSATIGGNTNFLNDMVIRDIADTADILMMGYYGYTIASPLQKVHIFPSSDVYKTLELVIHRLNAAFESPMDTTRFFDSLRVKGLVQLASVPYLYPNPGRAPAKNKHKTVSGSSAVPNTYALEQNYPNPFNPTTTISFNLAKQGLVTVKIFDVLGQEVATLITEQAYSPGLHSLNFNASNFASGVYFYRINVEGVNGEGMQYTNVKKMLLLK